MRIEELENNMYIKSTDTVEKYLLNIIQEYFKDSNEALEGSREYIIREAVDRLRTEMDYNSLGVLSITLPNGDVRTGDVTITLEDLGGEPLISPKLSAFNVNFGNKANTACEGNDPRLYNARKPIKHEHEITDVRGLEGILSTILGEINRVGTLNHIHDNKTILDILTYTGTNTKIDLGILDTLEPKIDEITEKIRKDIEKYIKDTETEIKKINEEIVKINQEIDKIHEFVIEKCEEYLKQAKQYTDQVIEKTTNELKIWIDNTYVKKEKIKDLIDIAKNCYTLVNTDSWDINEMFINTNETIRTFNLPFSQKTLDELQRRVIDLGSSRDIIFEVSIEYMKDDIIYRQSIPYADSFSSMYDSYLYTLNKHLTMAGLIQNIQGSNNALSVIWMMDETKLPTEIRHGKIVCDIYSKPLCPVYY